MQAIDMEVRKLFIALANSCDVGAAICYAVGTGKFNSTLNLGNICTRSGLPQSRAADVEAFLNEATSRGLFARHTESSWAPLKPDLHTSLAPLLAGAALYRSDVHRDRDIVNVVLTKPPSPSVVANELESMLRGSWGLLDTKGMFLALAEEAQTELAIMTPFLDEVGAPVVADLFVHTRAPRRTLIVRETPDGKNPPGLNLIFSDLNRLDVQVLNFRLDKPGRAGSETFHAKVILSDKKSAYVGSSNMNKWSFEYSLELGLYVSGQAAARLGDVVDAVKAVSIPIVAP